MPGKLIGAVFVRRVLSAIAVLALLLTGAYADVSMTIYPDSTLQTITGLGIGERIRAIRVREGPFYVTKPLTGIYDSLVYDLGISSFRHFMPEGWDASHHADLPTDVMKHMKELHERGVELFIATLLGPPGYMKTNGESCCGGNLLPEWRDSLAKTCVDYYRKVKEHAGVDLYALSVQNELMFQEPYGSCIYTPVTYRDLVAATVRVFRETDINLRIYGPEHVIYDVSNSLNFVRAVMADSVARTAFHAVAGHGYGGDASSPASDGAATWESYARFGNANGLEVWMTETSGNCDSTWSEGKIWEWTCNCIKTTPGGLPTGVALLNALKYGQLNNWNYLEVAKTSSTRQDLLFNADGPTYLYFAFKHFYRFIRPGAIQVGSSTSNDTLPIVVFKDPGRGIYTIVMANRTARPVTVSFDLGSGAGIPSRFAKFVSTRTRKCEEEPDSVVIAEGTVLPDSSLVTLYAGPADPVRAQVSLLAESVPSRRPSVSPASGTEEVSIYRLDGRCIMRAAGARALSRTQRLLNTRGSAAGAYVVVTTRADGAVIRRMTGLAESK